MLEEYGKLITHPKYFIAKGKGKKQRAEGIEQRA